MILGLSAPWRGMIAAILGLAAWQRFWALDRLLWSGDEMVTLFSGIRLHLLPWWNLGDHVRENFFKSLVMPTHGLGDGLFFYLVVGVFRLLDIPVTEAHLFQAGAVLSMVTLVLLFDFVRRRFGISAALVTLALAGWSPALIFYARTGYQVNFVMFLQVALFWAYDRYLQRRIWAWTSVMAILMALCAGSELFYLAPLLALFHLACSHAAPAPRRWWWPHDAVVWSGYATMMALNVFLFFKIGRALHLTLLGHTLLKVTGERSADPEFGLGRFLQGWNALMPFIPWFAAVASGSAVLLLLSQRRRDPLVRFFVTYMAVMAAVAYQTRQWVLLNLAHLVLPSLIVVAVASIEATAMALRPRARPPALAGPAMAAILALAASPWRAPASPLPVTPPAAYQSVKAVGYAIRELADAHPLVFVLSNQPAIPMAMEYYLGHAAAFGDRMPPHIYYVHRVDDRYLPSRVAAHLQLDGFDYYVDFVGAEFPGKPDYLADMRRQPVRLIREITSGGAVCARIYSRHPGDPKTLTVEEGNRGFDAVYARWGRLFHDRHAGAFYHFGPGY